MRTDKKIITVLSEIVKEFIGPFGDDIEKVERKVVENLLERGYEINEINDLLEELFDVMNIPTEKEIKIRVISPEEVANLKEDAREHLFYLKAKGVIANDDFEKVLNISSSIPYRVDKKELEKILKKEKLIWEEKLN
jgi:uncharacterized protein Smg (DUF494 family)